MVESWVGASPTFPDESGNYMAWPIPGRRIVIYWEVASMYGDYTSQVTPTCTITKPDGSQEQASLTEEFAPYRAFIYTPDVGGIDALYTGTVDYAGGASTPGGDLEPGSAPFDFHVRECLGDSGVLTETCWDNSVIVTKACVDGYLVDTGQTCPPEIICEEGNVRTPLTCEDGSIIYQEVCTNNSWVPSEQECPPPVPFEIPWWLLVLLGVGVVTLIYGADQKKKRKG